MPENKAAPKCQCVPDCPRRTATCKVDGSCPEFIEYDKARIASYEEKDRTSRKNRASNPFLGAAHQRIVKENNRYQMRRMRRERV